MDYFVTAVLRGALNLFIRLLTAVVGGSIYLSLQPDIQDKAQTYGGLSNVIVVLAAFLACAMIFENTRAWVGHRKAQSRLGGLDQDKNPRIPLPRVVRASVAQGIMVVSIIIATGLFWYFNPFLI